uniref:Uncharacterized protein n=1 Tax=Amphimedon queenslandica TaxID=400682 RepID=A0A1X7UW05_AMPQE
MSSQSDTVPLGVILKNENVIEEMIEVLLKLQSYVPTQHHTDTDQLNQQEVNRDIIHKLLFGGDQLTRKRVQSATEG